MPDFENVKITVLADNAATPPYRAEHGFSALVEAHREDGATDAVLFDVGMGALFGNAALAGVDLSRVTDVALSHGHYDHTDALGAFLERYPDARVHASTEVFRDHYSLRTGTCRKIALSDGESRHAFGAPRRTVSDFRGSRFDFRRAHSSRRENTARQSSRIAEPASFRKSWVYDTRRGYRRNRPLDENFGGARDPDRLLSCGIYQYLRIRSRHFGIRRNPCSNRWLSSRERRRRTPPCDG